MQATPPPFESDSRESASKQNDDSLFASRVRTAVLWRWGAQVGSQIITWTSTFLVVRLLDPTDYGLFAMSQVVVTALAFLNGASFATSLVQAQHVDERRVGQVFGMLLLANFTLAAVQFLLAPSAAQYFGEPIVADMLRLQAIIFLTVPFTALPGEWLARSLDFRKAGQVNMASAVIGALTALLLAWLGWGVWALIYAGLAIFISRAAGLMTFTPDMTDLPQNQTFQPGDTWYFQLWYRDGAASNFSSSLCFTWQ